MDCQVSPLQVVNLLVILSLLPRNGQSDVLSSLRALSSLYSTAPDQAQMLVGDSLPAICQILEDVHTEIEIQICALEFLERITNRSPHSLFLKSGIIPCLIKYLR